MTTTEEHLGRFYIELQAWIDGGCKKHRSFSAKSGICEALYCWANDNGASDALEYDLFLTNTNLFRASGLGSTYPFGGSTALDRERRAAAVYTNPARLAWIKEHAEAAKAAGMAVQS